MSIRYLLDVRFARPGGLDGVGRYLWSLAAALPAALGGGEALVLLCHDDDVVRWRKHVPSARVLGTDLPIASMAQHLRWGRLVREAGAKVVHYPQYDLPLVPDGVGAIATVYDFTPIDEPRYFGAGRSWRRLAATGLLVGSCVRASRVVTLSHASARSLMDRVPSVAGRVRVTTPGPSHLRLAQPQPPGGACFVYVGNHRPHKRVPVLLRAFAEVRRRRPDVQLVLLGRRDPRFPEVPLLLTGPLGAGVTLVEDADDDAVAAAVAGATALVFASVGEGYGFPVTEALGLGVPAIVADAGSLPEVVDGAGLVVSPAGDEAGWTRSMLRLLDEPGLRRNLVSRATDVVAALDWDLTARQTLSVWREALR